MKTIIDIVDIRKDIQGKETVVAWHGKPLSQTQIERAKKRFGVEAGRFLIPGDSEHPLKTPLAK
jgi:transketolase